MSRGSREKTQWWQELGEAEGGVNLRPAKARPAHRKQPAAKARSELAGELYQPEADYPFSYKAARYEREWLIQSLGSFYDDSLVVDVLGLVRAGKEANVYCCRGNPGLEMDLLAAKVYRPRMLRNLKNDAIYKEGRPLLDEDGKALRDHRSQRAVRNKTRVGSEMSITSWIEYEFQAMRRLHQAGADIPRPVAHAGNTILMEYIGEAGSPAPILSSVVLPEDEVRPLFERLVGNIALMLENGLVHADLSPYNVLYWEGETLIIDFPQVVDPFQNRLGFDLLLRDVERICQYFARYGLRSRPRALAGELWNRVEQGKRGEDMPRLY